MRRAPGRAGSPVRLTIRGATIRLVPIAAAVVAALVRLPPAWVERWYSEGVYLAVQARLTPLSNLVPWALFDPLLAAAAVGLVAAWARALRRAPRGRRWTALPGIGLSTLSAAAWAYLAFLAIWGLNYERVPLADKLRFDPASVTRGAQRALALTAAAQLDALYPARRTASWPVFGRVPVPLARAFGEVQRELGMPETAVPGIPKATLLEPYFDRAAIDGLTDPYLLEVLLDDRLLPFERPFVLAHEWAHLAGYADESEANFLGWLTCLRSNRGDQYSGWLFLFSQTLVGLPPADQQAAIRQLTPGPRADLEAVRARILSGLSPRVQQAAWGLYDRYLKANRVPGGVANYEAVIRLILGTRFGPAWQPELRGANAATTRRR